MAYYRRGSLQTWLTADVVYYRRGLLQTWLTIAVACYKHGLSQPYRNSLILHRRKVIKKAKGFLWQRIFFVKYEVSLCKSLVYIFFQIYHSKTLYELKRFVILLHTSESPMSCIYLGRNRASLLFINLPIRDTRRSEHSWQDCEICWMRLVCHTPSTRFESCFFDH